jgi:hypothetical protein
MSKGMLLADVHPDNIGKRGSKLVIFDPGHMVPLSAKWLEIQVPVLE